jgi:hypothetical protein
VTARTSFGRRAAARVIFALAILTLGRPVVPAVAQSPASAAAPSPAAASAPAWPIKIVLTPATLAGLPRREAAVTDMHGGPATYAGVELGAVLARAGVPQGEALRGRDLAAYAIAIASDGYRAVFALPELDPAFTDRLVLLADQRNGQPLPASLAPFRIVIPDEKRQARWIRNVVEIDVELVPGAAGPPPGGANGSTHGT